jgi:hypothetical protein
MICCLTRIIIIITATYQTGVGEGIGNTQIKTYQAHYSWFPAEFKPSSTDTFRHPPGTNERENFRHREKSHDSYSPKQLLLPRITPEKIKDNKNIKKSL